MLKLEDRLFKFKGRTALLQYLVKTGSWWATISLGPVDELPIEKKRKYYQWPYPEADTRWEAADPVSCQYVRASI